MFKIISASFFLFLINFSLAFGSPHVTSNKEEKLLQPETTEEEEIQLSQTDISRASRAFAQLIGKNLKTLGVEWNFEDMMQGIKEGVDGNISEKEEEKLFEAIAIVRERAFRKLASKNLDEASAFLTENAGKQGVLELEKNRLQYRIEKMGEGAVVESHHSPMIRYTGKFIDGQIFGGSQEGELISLQETIPGFTKGIVGMKEGEKRTIFIHPELGYGSMGHLPPNSLLIFDIEVIKANGESQQDLSPISVQPPLKSDDEIVDQTDREEKAG